MGNVVRLPRPWSYSDAGWRSTRAEVEARVRRWRTHRFLEAWLVELPLAALACTVAVLLRSRT